MSVSERLDYIKSALDASQAAGSVLTAISEGNLTPLENYTRDGAY